VLALYQYRGIAAAPNELQQESAEGGQIATTIGTTIATLVGGPMLGALVGGAIMGATQLVVAVEGLFSGCGQTCTEATTIVNQVEPYLVQNNEAYFTNPNRTVTDQQNALATAQNIFAVVVSKCGVSALGAAGQACVQDRFGNTCKFGLTTENEYPPYCSVPYPVGVCWNWTLAYYNPILNDVPPGGAGTSLTSSGSSLSSTQSAGISLPLLLVAAVILFFVAEEMS